jgi:hypothetical protein
MLKTDGRSFPFRGSAEDGSVFVVVFGFFLLPGSIELGRIDGLCNTLTALILSSFINGTKKQKWFCQLIINKFGNTIISYQQCVAHCFRFDRSTIFRFIFKQRGGHTMTVSL